MKAKVKTRIISVMLIIAMVCVNSPMFEIEIYGKQGFRSQAIVGDITWEAVIEYDSYNVGLVIKSVNNENATLRFLTKEDVVNNFSGQIVNWMDKGQLYFDNYYVTAGIDKVKSLVVMEDYPIFPKSGTIYNGSSHDIFQNNSSITDITVNTGGKNGFEIREETFYNMQKLKNVTIEVGSGQTIILDGSVFANCPELTEVTLTGNVRLDGSLNFAGCTKLKTFIVNGNLTVNGSQDFADCTSLETFQTVKYVDENNKEIILEGNVNFNGDNTFTGTTFSSAAGGANLSFAGTVSSKQFGEANGVFMNCKNINTISLNGNGNNLNSNFINSAGIQNLNIEGNTTLDEEAISNSSVTNVSFNQKTTLENSSFYKDKIEKMYFNTSAVTGKLGNETSVAEMFYNNKGLDPKDEDKVTELANLSLEDVTCSNMYFLSPNFEKMNNVSCENGTTVYGYGGKLVNLKDENDANNINEPVITSKDMFEKWTEDNGSTYKNIVSLKKEDLPSEINLYVNDANDSVNFDFSSLEITASYDNIVTKMEALPNSVKNLIGDGEYNLPYTTDPEGDTNFAYKVLKEVNSATVNETIQYVYNNENFKGENASYVTCEEQSVSLQSGDYRYYVQAGGITWPLDVHVIVNEVKAIEVKPVSGDVLHLTEGENVDTNDVKKRLKVTAIFEDDKKEVLQPSQFEIRTQDYKTEISKEDTNLIVSYKIEGKAIKQIFNFTEFIVHENKVVSFEVTSDKKYMADGSTLKLEDISVKNVKYDNPDQKMVSEVESGFKFVQDGVVKDTYQIVKDENNLAVTYADCTMNCALTIIGVDNTVSDFEVFCSIDEVELYKKNTLNVSEISLRNVKYKDARLKDEAIIESGFVFTVNGEEKDTVELTEDKNVIGVKYNGLDKYNAITIKGIPTTIERIEAQYIGPAIYEGCEVSTDTKVLMVTVYRKHPDSMDLLLSNYDVSYGTYHIVPGEDNQIYVYYKGMKSTNPVSVKGLADQVVAFNKIEYKGNTKAGTVVNKADFYVELKYASGKIVNSEQNPEILNPLVVEDKILTNGENTIKLTYNDKETLQGTITVNGTQGELTTAAPAQVTTTPAITTAPTVTATPEITPVTTGGSGQTGTPENTTIPSETPDVSSSSKVEKPKKGKTYAVQGVKYKVTKVQGKGGEIEAIGYDKKADKVKVQTTVKINGYSFAVKKIQKNAFKNCSKLTGTLSFTKNVKIIGENAFLGCKNVKKVVFGSNVTQIGKNSFYKCGKLNTIQFKTGSVKKIGKNAFKGIQKKYTLKCPKALKKTYKKRLKNAV